MAVLLCGSEGALFASSVTGHCAASLIRRSSLNRLVIRRLFQTSVKMQAAAARCDADWMIIEHLPHPRTPRLTITLLLCRHPFLTRTIFLGWSKHFLELSYSLFSNIHPLQIDVAIFRLIYFGSWCKLRYSWCQSVDYHPPTRFQVFIKPHGVRHTWLGVYRHNLRPIFTEEE